jgi:hypothetical protein
MMDRFMIPAERTDLYDPLKIPKEEPILDPKLFDVS